jgi:LacI family transcriptional regulator
VTGVVCSVDELALNTLFIARSNGLSVPQDLSITGMDNIEEARREGLTTLHISFDVVGRAAVNSLVSMLHGTSYEDASVILPLELIVRSSSGPVPHTFAPQSGPRA